MWIYEHGMTLEGKKKQNDQSSQFEESNFGAVADQNKAIKSMIPTQIGSAQNV